MKKIQTRDGKYFLNPCEKATKNTADTLFLSCPKEITRVLSRINSDSKLRKFGYWITKDQAGVYIQ